MIESLINPRSVEKHPWEAFIAGFLFTIVACLLTLQIGVTSGAGFLVVSFITIAAAPFIVRVFDIEEKKHGGNLFQRHMDVIRIYAFFFIAVIFASSLIFVMMPTTSSSGLFTEQVHDLCSKNIITDTACGTGAGSISGEVTGKVLMGAGGGAALGTGGGGSVSGAAITAMASSSASAFRPGFADIFVNNMEVLVLAFVLSLMLGAGAIFLIAWNATIIGVLIAKIAETPAAFGALELMPGNTALNYIFALPYTLLLLLPHGIFEFGAYFIGAVAGGILSVAIIREKYKMGSIMPIAFDSLKYFAIAVALLLVGAVIEVGI
ncbi:MAG: stage II sporulation protein M [Candidatus Micrarchaeota archaeon]